MIKTKITTRKDGYQVFTLNGKTKYLHRYLAEKYIPNPENKSCVNHIDGNPSNNSIDNLEWVTRRENCEHARLNGLSELKSQGIKSLTYEEYLEMIKLRDSGLSYRKIGKIMKLEYRRIIDTINGKRYKDYKIRKEAQLV
jgi:hypothetical protein